jgi:hypothetical protein
MSNINTYDKFIKNTINEINKSKSNTDISKSFIDYYLNRDNEGIIFNNIKYRRELQAVSTNFIAKIYSGADYIKSVIDKNSKITMNELCTMLKNIPAFYSQLSINEVNIIVISITENGTSNDVLFVYNDDDIDIINLINSINKKYLATYHKMITISSDDRQKLIKKTLQNDMKKLSDICSKLDTENKYKAWQPRAVVKNIF